MKHPILVWIWILCIPMLQAQDSLFVWNNDTLSLEAPAEPSSAYYARFSQVADNAQWQITACFDFAPSSSNYARWYLMADTDTLTAATAGYFVLLGQVHKQISLCRQDAGRMTRLVSTPEDVLQADTPYSLIVTRRGDTWSLVVAGLDTVYTAVDDRYCTSGYEGVLCTYTKTRSQGFHFYQWYTEGDTCVQTPTPTPDFDTPSPIALGIRWEPEYPVVGETMHWLFAFSESVKLRAGIYALTGQEVARIYNHEEVREEVVAWRAVDKQGRSLLPGIYLLYVESVQTAGQVVRKKIPFVLAPTR